jgi:Ca-activated chloride channel family protein
MTFGAPQWFWAFAVLPVLVALYLRAERRRRITLREFVSPRLLPELAGNVARTRRAIRFVCVLLSIACAITALAKPRWGYAYEEVKRRGLDLLLAVDTSRSMLSNDVSPNRLARVKLATQDLINELTGDRVGLIAFAGRAFLQAPLTIDYDAAVESINDLDTKTIPEGGTNISEAIALAVRTFGKSATGNRALIIFTDGEELSGNAVKEAKNAADTGVRIFTIGVGTAQGSLIPIESENGSAFVKDAKGQVVKSRLDENRLREIAQTTGGSYFHLENGPQTMRQLYEQGLAKLQTGEIDARLSRRPIERYEWPLAAAIIALAASVFINDRKRTRHRAFRPLATAALVLLASNIFAAAPGIEEYRQQKYNEALQQFQTVLSKHPQNRAADKLAFDSGAAAYKLHDYENALQAFSQALLSPDAQLQSKGHYNLGNTLYQRGEAQKGEEKKLSDWTNALKHYEETLKISPQDKEAKDNYEFVKKKIEELKNKQEQPSPTPPPQQQPQKEKKNQQQNQDQQKQEQSKDSQQQQQNEKDQQQQSQQNQQQQQEQRNGSNRQSQQQNKDSQGQSSDQQRDQNNGKSSPSPSPNSSSRPESSPSDNQQKQDQSPSPSNGSGSPSPSQPKSGTSPSPSPAENAEANNQPSPTPSASPEKRRSGDIKAAGDLGTEKEKQEAAAAEAEAEQRGEMTPQQADQLLRAMKDEEARVQLNEHKPVHRVYNDW